MKHLLFLALAVIGLSTCSKKDPFERDKNLLAGFWNLTEITGGIAGTGYEATFDQLQLTRKGRYALLSQDAAVQEGAYQLSEEDGQLFIRFNPDISNGLFFHDQEKEISWVGHQGPLVLSDPCCDLFVYRFERDEE